MSVFIVENETINKIISGMTNSVFLKNKYKLESNTARTLFGRKLLSMNLKSYNNRYVENNSEDPIISDYQFRFILCSNIQI